MKLLVVAIVLLLSLPGHAQVTEEPAGMDSVLIVRKIKALMAQRIEMDEKMNRLKREHQSTDSLLAAAEGRERHTGTSDRLPRH